MCDTNPCTPKTVRAIHFARVVMFVAIDFNSGFQIVDPELKFFKSARNFYLSLGVFKSRNLYFLHRDTNVQGVSLRLFWGSVKLCFSSVKSFPGSVKLRFSSVNPCWGSAKPCPGNMTLGNFNPHTPTVPSPRPTSIYTHSVLCDKNE